MATKKKYNTGDVITDQAEIEQFIKDNPDYGYQRQDATGNTVEDVQGQSKSYGILDDIGAALVSPFSNFQTGTAEQLRQKVRLDKGLDQPGGDYDPMYMSRDDWDQYVKNPLGKNAQNVAGVVGSLLPAGSGIAGLAKAGAITGAASGFSNSDMREGLGSVAENTLKSAAIGGAVGGGLGILGKGAGKLASKFSGSTDEAAKGITGVADDLTAKYDDILSNPNLTKSAGLGTNSAKPFNQAFNDLTKGLNNLDDPLQRQGLNEFLTKIKPAADAGFKDAADVLKAAKSIYGNYIDDASTAVANTADEVGKGVAGAVDNSADEAARTSTRPGAWLRKQAQDREQVALNKSIGIRAPATGAGLRGAELERYAIDAAKSSNIPIKSAEDLGKLGGKLLNENSGKVAQMAQDVSDAGAAISLDDVLAPLRAKAMEETNERLRAPIEKVIGEITDEFKGAATISPAQLYKAKQGWGEIANFLDDSGKSIQSVYGKLYHSGNDVLENTLENSGAIGFKDINRKVEAGLKMQKWADSAAAKARPGMTVTDMLQDAMGFGGMAGGATGMAVGGPVGAAVGYGASKFMQSAAGERLAGRVFNKAADVADYLGGKGAVKIPIPGNMDMTRVNGAIQALGNSEVVQKASQIADKVANSPTVQKLGVLGTVGSTNQDKIMNTPPVTPEITREQMSIDRSNKLKEAMKSDPGSVKGVATSYAEQNAPKADTIVTAELLSSDPGVLKKALQDPVTANIVFQMAGYDAKESAQMLQLMGLSSDPKDAGKGKDKAKLDNAVSEMKRLYGMGTKDSLSQGDVTVGPLGTIGRIGQDIRKGTDQGYQDKLKAYTQMSTLAMGILNQMRGAGTLNEGEAQLMMKNMPNEYSSNKEADEWFNNVGRMLVGGSDSGSNMSEDELTPEMLAML